MPLKVQKGDGAIWQDIGLLGPTDSPASISNNIVPPERYIFRCNPQDMYSTLMRSKPGLDIKALNFKEMTLEGFEVVTTLRKGESHELSIVARNGSMGKVKFTHI